MLLHIIGTLDPRYGGSVEALRQLIIALLKLGHKTEILTLDSADSPWIANFPGVTHCLGSSIGKYRYNKKLLEWLDTYAKDYDAIIVHGIWQYHSFATWISHKKNHFPYFIFVHGALDPWFKNHYPIKHIKKWLYWPWAEYRVLRDAAAVLYTCEEERLLARKSFWLYKAREKIVTLGIQSPPSNETQQREAFLVAYPHLRNKRILLFLGRIHVKKGCDLLIKAFAQVSKRNNEVYLVIAGSDQDGWQAKLQEMAIALGINECVTWTGMLSGDVKWGACRCAEAFVLPSHSENFGIVVAEALACGLPVLITDKVNIWREIANDNAGLIATDTLDAIIEQLEKWLSFSDLEKGNFANNALKCFDNHFEIHKTAQTFVKVISSELNLQ